MKNMFNKKSIVGITIITIIIIISCILLSQKKKCGIDNLDIQTKVAKSYKQITDKDMSVNNGIVKFGAYFLKDIDEDGYNERLLGSCNKVDGSDTLVLDLNISGDGVLKDGVIKIESTNFTYKMAELEDIVLNGNYVSNNVKQINLKELPSGTQRLIMGTIHSNISEPDDYSKDTKITLQGTYVCEGQEDVQINKSFDITADWYGTATSKISYTSKRKYDYASYDNIDQINKNFIFNFTLKRAEEENSLLVKAHHIDIEIPSLKNEYPTIVTCNDKNYSYDEEKHILSINKDTSCIEETYTVTLVYPDSVYEQIINDNKNGIVDSIYPVIRGRLECYNNSKEEFTNPYVTNTSVATATIQIGSRGTIKAGHIAKVAIQDKDYVGIPYRQNVISKQAIIDAYNTEENVDNMRYIVLWSVYRDTIDTEDSTIVFKDRGDRLNSNITNSELYINSVGVYFGTTALIPNDGTISIYNDETGELIKKFKEGEWKLYNSKNPYYYDSEVKKVRIETSEEQKSTSSLEIYNIREININKLKEQYDRKAIEDLSELSTRASLSGSKISNEAYGTDEVQLACEKSYAEISVSPSTMRTSEINPVTETIRIKVPPASITCSKWQNGTFMIEIPSKIVDINLVNAQVTGNTEIVNAAVIKIGDKKFIKVITQNSEPTSNFEITLETKMQVNPMASNSQEQFKLYTYNEYCNIYYGSTEDVYDINGNNNKTEAIGSNYDYITVDAADGFVTTETVTNYDDEKDDEITVAPNVAKVTQKTRQATVNVQFMNNYTQKASNVEVIGRIPFEGNTYMNGQTLHSAFTANITNGGIKVPDEIKDKVTIYYSENGNATKDLTDTANGWVSSKNVTNLSNIKSYLIIIEGDIQRAKAYSFSYDVVIPEGISPNLATFSSHMVYFDLTINGALTSLSVQPRKVGIRIAKYYGMEILKYKEGTELPVEGATYTLTALDEEGNPETIESTSSSDGKLILDNLRVNQIYTFKELHAPNNYSLSNNVIEFKVVENNNTLEYVLLSDINFDGDVSLEQLNGKYTLKSYVYDTPKYQLTINKKDSKTNEKLPNITFRIDAKGYTSNSEGKIVTDNLELNKEYTLSEIRADGYYILDDIKFSVVKNETGELSFVSDNDTIEVLQITNNNTEDLAQVSISISNDKIPTYNLQVIKVEENDNVKDIESLKKLQGAEFILYSEDFDKEETYITDENGNINISNLYQFVEEKQDKISARYMLKEKNAPKGYVNSEETIYFRAEKNADGIIDLQIEDKDNKTTIKDVITEGDTVKLVLQNKALFQVTKIDSETNKPLANVEFKIMELNENGDFKNFAKDIYGNVVGEKNGDDEYTVKTDENGVIALPLKDGKYAIVEVGFPKGYEKNEKVEYFEIVTNTDKDLEANEPEPDSELISNIIEINTIDELVEFSNSVNGGETYEGKIVRLTRDLDFLSDDSYSNGSNQTLKEQLTNEEGAGFTPIGSTGTFRGVFDGYGHEIKNIYINSENTYTGLFGQIYGAKVTNVGVSGKITGTSCTGGIAGIMLQSSRIINCHNSANVTGGSYTGGIAGQIVSPVNDKNYDASIIECYNTGKITGSNETGGILGLEHNNIDCNVVNICYNTGSVTTTGTSTSAAGIVAHTTGNIKNCYNTGNINAVQYAGGIAGNEVKSISYAYNIGDISSSGENGSAGAISATSGKTNSGAYYLRNCSINATNKGDTGIAVDEQWLKSYVIYPHIWIAGNEDINNGYPTLNIGDKKIRKIEDLVDLSIRFNNHGFIYDGVTLENDLDFNEDSSYRDKDSTKYGDLNGDGHVQTLKEELTTGAFLPIGTNSTPFVGRFDGQGHSINGLRTNAETAGLFGEVKEAVIENLSVNGNITGTKYAGGIAGRIYHDSTGENRSIIINNCHFSGEVHGGTGDSGGIVGYTPYGKDGTNISVVISNCSNEGIIQGSRVGGIVGEQNSGKLTIHNSYNIGQIIGTSSGGIIGLTIDSASETELVNCYNTANITGSNYAGGLIGNKSDGKFNVKDCHNEGQIDGTGGIAGLIGRVRVNPSIGCIENCYNKGNIVTGGSGYVGGLVGDAYLEMDLTIKNCYNEGTISGAGGDWMGGIVGVSEGMKIEKCYNLGDINVTEADWLGGILGYSAGSSDLVSIKGCYNKGSINVTGGYKNVGGILGYNAGTTSIEECYNDAEIFVSGSCYIGGITGYGGYTENLKVSKCYNLGELKSEGNGYPYIGGISGNAGTIDNSYNKGNIIANNSYAYIGGVVGGYSSVNVRNCYNEGDIILNSDSTTSNYIGGIMSGGESTAECCYNNGNITATANGSTFIGGIEGYSSRRTQVKNCYNTGDISNTSSRTSYVGGITSWGTATNCYNTGNIESYINANNATDKQSNYIGPIVSYYSSNEPNNCYYVEDIGINGITIFNNEKNDATINNYGEAKSSDHMKTEEFYNTLNVDGVWSYRGYTYPRLTEMPIKSAVGTNIIIKNNPVEYSIKTYVNKYYGVKGGSISGETDFVYESVKYGKSNTKPIEMTPIEGYRISSIAINGEEIAFKADETTNAYTIPAEYFKSMREDKNIVVTFAPEDKVLTITKVDSATKDVLPGARFKIEQKEERETNPEIISSRIGDIVNNGQTCDKMIPDVMTIKTNDGFDSMHHYGDQEYMSTNRSNNSSSHLCFEINLEGLEGNYKVGLEAEISSERYDYGYAIVNTSPDKPSTSATNFMRISGKTSRTKYKSSVLTGGSKYYLHLMYVKDGSKYSGNDRVYIYNPQIYEDGVTTNYYFEENEDGQYVSNNKGIHSSEANSYIPIDLTNTFGKYNLIVNAEISSESEDRGKIRVTNEIPTEGATYDVVAMHTLNGEQEAKDYKIILSAGEMYYLNFIYTKNGYDNGGADAFKINSVNLTLNTDDYVTVEAITDENGQITQAVQEATYIITELEAPKGYRLDSTPHEYKIQSSTDNKIEIENTFESNVVAHYYKKDTTESIRDDIELRGGIGEQYKTEPYLEIDEYTLLKDENGEYIIPENATGTFKEGTTEVCYYYDIPEYGYTLRYFYDGQENTELREIVAATKGTIIERADIDERIENNKIEGYALSDVQTLPLEISLSPSEHIIDIYYEKDTFNYTINYYYDGVKNEEKTETYSAVFGSEVTGYIDKNIEGYKLQYAKAINAEGNEEDLPLVIKEDESKNIINVYYVKDELGYEVHYFYDGKEDTLKMEAQNSTIGKEITEYIDKNIDGYKLEGAKTLDDDGNEVDLPLVIKEDKSKNIINVYYVKDEFKYEVHYFYNGKEDETKKEEGKAIFGSEITEYTDKNIKGYKLEKAKAIDADGNEVELPLIIKSNVENNRINVYYINNEGKVNIKYVDNLTGEEIKGVPEITITGIVGEPYNVERKEIPGYKLDIDNLPTNEHGEFTLEGDTITYQYIELRPYELIVRYTAGDTKIDEAKITVEYGDIVKDEYTKNGILKVDNIELTDLKTENYIVFESETPEYCKTIVSKEKPAVVELMGTLNKDKNKYEYVANYEEMDGFNVIIDEENRQVIFDIKTEKNEKYDLAIKKFITSIDETAIEDRAPKVIVDEEGKISYSVNDRIEQTANNQMITYTIRTYNESELKAKGKRIIEYIPDGLVFVPENEINKKYEWNMYKQNEEGKLVITTNVEEAELVASDYIVDKNIPAFDKSNKNVSYLDVQAVFKVDETKITSEDRIIENIVQIMPNENDDNKENDTTTEKVYVKYFDLSIEKYIENVKINTNGNEEIRQVGRDKKGQLVKVDVKQSLVNNTKLTVTYGLVIKNVGEIAGYATEIKDYIPKDFKLVSTDKWSIQGDIAVNTSLKDVILEPGESTVEYITFEWELSENNIGERFNEAEISEYKNQYNAVDITDDNKDKEGLLVTLKTGAETIAYVALAVIFIATISTGTYIIKMKIRDGVQF